MTYIYQWYGWPRIIEIACPYCGGKAQFSNPKAVIELKPSATKPAQRVHAGRHNGRLSCLLCGANKVESIAWPESAYYKGEIKGHVLWAWNKEHAVAIRDYLQSENRNRHNHQFVASLYHLPEVFKLSKNRHQCIKVLNKAIARF